MFLALHTSRILSNHQKNGIDFPPFEAGWSFVTALMNRMWGSDTTWFLKLCHKRWIELSGFLRKCIWGAVSMIPKAAVLERP